MLPDEGQNPCHGLRRHTPDVLLAALEAVRAAEVALQGRAQGQVEDAWVGSERLALGATLREQSFFFPRFQKDLVLTQHCQEVAVGARVGTAAAKAQRFKHAVVRFVQLQECVGERVVEEGAEAFGPKQTVVPRPLHGGSPLNTGGNPPVGRGPAQRVHGPAAVPNSFASGELEVHGETADGPRGPGQPGGHGRGISPSDCGEVQELTAASAPRRRS